MKKIFKFSVLILLVVLASCNTVGFDAALKHGPQPGQAAPEIVQGWQDGCETGLSVYGSDLYKTMYSFQQDKRMVTNIRYYTAWKDGMDYCRHWINEGLKGGMLGKGLSEDLRDERAATQGKGLTPDFLGW